MSRGTTTVLARWAPDVVRPWQALVAQAGTGETAALVGLLRSTCAAANGLDGLPLPPGIPTLPEYAPVVVEFAEQFCVDVSSVDDELRGRFTEAVGAESGNVVAALWVADMLPRVDHALTRLFPEDADSDYDEIAWRTPSDLLTDVVARLIPAMGQLQALDAVTTEVVRLRGAAAHNCRLCKSLRDTTAIAAGADESVLSGLADDAQAQVDLEPRHRAAVALADAVIWSPAHLSDDLLADVRRHLSPEEQLEVVLDVARNGVNKIMVALGADAARVTDGVEHYHVGSDGIPVFAEV
ncbi:carboxymuconolactone decarboxylase family protein [Nocardioides daejeonensis]|uniref:carboxymuconolactone decarboxylase family protein n=1 Tax=Nocardioides daejeonensis TaxID=1046556 RepID=UPI000D7463AB|nr:carboxymuconolactone decarboxylase family protein [Nocardioides daejeonensis]